MMARDIEVKYIRCYVDDSSDIGEEVNDDDVYVGHILEYAVPTTTDWGETIEGYSQLGVASYDKWEGFRYTTARHISGKDMNLGIPIGRLDNFKIVGNIYENPELLEGN